MRPSLVLLSGLASLVLAYPADVSVDRRTSALVPEILDDVLGLGDGFSTTMFAGLSAHGAAALEGSVLGCAASIIQPDARNELRSWLISQTSITGSIQASLLSWCESSVTYLEEAAIAALAVYLPTCAGIAASESIYVSIDGIFDASEIDSTLVLSESAQATLAAFVDAHVDLDADVLAGLSLCAGGGVVGSLTADTQASLLAWVTGPDCSLGASLQVAVRPWIKDEPDSGLAEAEAVSADALTAISVASSIEVFVGESGILATSAMASIAAFLEAEVDLDVHIRVALTACGAGKIASTLSLELRTFLARWLIGASCSLGVELKAVVLLWLSAAVTAEASVSIVANPSVDISSFMTEGTISLLSINLRGALALLDAGGSLILLSWQTRAELAAFLSGCTDIEISMNVRTMILEWLTGCGTSTSSVSSPSSTSPVSIFPLATGSLSSGLAESIFASSDAKPTGSTSFPSSGALTGPVSISSSPTGSGSALSSHAISPEASGPATSDFSGPAASVTTVLSTGCGASPSETRLPGDDAGHSETDFWVATYSTSPPTSGVPGYTSTVAAPVPTSTPIRVSSESSGIYASTLIITQTVCECEA
ncbi:hypothetical protein N7540_011178 [Penicillium herquei]|nr:hypothetical protein N7540_011178 [Penicillium herquei]